MRALRRNPLEPEQGTLAVEAARVADQRPARADDPMAVCDPAARVYGVERLRVCDASLFPAVPRANTNIPTIMCAEKIADAALKG